MYLSQHSMLQNKIDTLSLHIAGEEAGSFTIAFIFPLFPFPSFFSFFLFLFYFLFALIQVSGRLDWLVPFPSLSVESWPCLFWCQSIVISGIHWQ